MTEQTEAELLKGVQNFFHRYRFIREITRQAQRQIDRATAPDFSVFNYFYCDEARMSDIIKDLLDPRGSHGQGPLFLEMFLRRVNLALPVWEQLDTARLEMTEAALEVSTSCLKNTKRRIDIVLVNPAWVMGIENKPKGWEQEKQLEDYRTHLERAHPDRPCCMVYLPGDCSLATTDGAKKAVLIGYNWSLEKCGLKFRPFHLSDWLEEASQSCQADKVRHFLNDFALWIRKKFNNHPQTTGHKEPSNEHMQYCI